MADSASSENSFSTISNPKNSPVIGALNVAEIPPAAPQATITRSRALAHPHQLPERGGERRADLDDRPLAADRPAAADAQRRRQRLDDRHRRADPPAVLGDREHHLGDAVPARLAREALDQRPVEERRAITGTTSTNQMPRNGRCRLGGVSLLAERRWPGEQPREE